MTYHIIATLNLKKLITLWTLENSNKILILYLYGAFYIFAEFKGPHFYKIRGEMMNTIMIVDDEEKIRSVYGKIFKREGYTVLDAGNTEEAHELLLKNKIDLILLDINMAKVDGTIFYKIIDEFYPNAKVIVSSVYPMEDQKILIKGATEYYDKSDSIKILIHKVKEVLKN